MEKKGEERRVVDVDWQHKILTECGILPPLEENAEDKANEKAEE